MQATSETVPVTTTTGELFLPTRLIYEIYDARQLRIVLPIRSCMEWSPEKQSWSWNYAGPVRRLGFPPSYEALPKEHRAIVLAWCRLVDDHTFHVYTRCGFRAAKFLEFFDQQVSRKIALGRFIDQYNWVTRSLPSDQPPPPEEFFRDESKMVFHDILALMDQPESSAKQQALKETLAALAQAPLHPLVRQRLDKFYNDGPEAIPLDSQMRELLAMEQAKSKTPIRLAAAIDKIVRTHRDRFPV